MHGLRQRKHTDRPISVQQDGVGGAENTQGRTLHYGCEDRSSLSAREESKAKAKAKTKTKAKARAKTGNQSTRVHPLVKRRPLRILCHSDQRYGRLCLETPRALAALSRWARGEHIE